MIGWGITQVYTFKLPLKRLVHGVDFIVLLQRPLLQRGLVVVKLAAARANDGSSLSMVPGPKLGVSLHSSNFGRERFWSAMLVAIRPSVEKERLRLFSTVADLVDQSVDVALADSPVLLSALGFVVVVGLAF